MLKMLNMATCLTPGAPLLWVAETEGLLELADCQIGYRLNERPCVPGLW